MLPILPIPLAKIYGFRGISRWQVELWPFYCSNEMLVPRLYVSLPHKLETVGPTVIHHFSKHIAKCVEIDMFFTNTPVIFCGELISNDGSSDFQHDLHNWQYYQETFTDYQKSCLLLLWNSKKLLWSNKERFYGIPSSFHVIPRSFMDHQQAFMVY